VPALVRELIKDTRRMMAPFTALKLTERKSNRLKDFVAMSGALGVSHMLCYSTTETVNVEILSNFFMLSQEDAVA
jgi:ribosome biogenesis protein SSF1/2